MTPELINRATDWFVLLLVVVFGGLIGSFLNVCIYRVPLNLSVNNPRRSFCPLCQTSILWWHNVPVLGWLMLRGRCAACHGKISVRYPIVEACTAAIFLLLWLRYAQTPACAAVYAGFSALLVVGALIDYDYLILPDPVTLGGTAAGLFACLVVPRLMGCDQAFQALVRSLMGAMLGVLPLWVLLEAGKLFFGKKKVVLSKPEQFTWNKRADGEDAEFTLAGHTEMWGDLFCRDNDVMVLRCGRLDLAGTTYQDAEVHCTLNQATIDGQALNLDEIQSFEGVASGYDFPREAMGLGDVKLMACVGAFLGWQGALYTVFVGILFGAGAGVAGRMFNRDAPARLPFGPSLACAALLWLLAGPETMRWYLALVS